MIYLLLIIGGVCAVAAIVATLGRTSRPDEVERFHRARAMTTEWSRHHPAHLVEPSESFDDGLELPAQATDQRQPQPADH